MIGDLISGYMLSPADTSVKVRLTAAAAKHRVPVDGIIREMPLSAAQRCYAHGR
jgi:hypothetical protein